MTAGKPENRDQPPAPGKIGIFWVFHGRLLAAASELADGEAYGDAIDARIDHVHHWPHFQEQHPALRRLEYQHVPRGRIVFKRSSGRFLVYMDKSLHQAKIKRAILCEFQLPASKTGFLTDPHYTTNQADLDHLFNTE